MSEQPLDLGKAVHSVRKHWVIVLIFLILGALAGGAYSVLDPPSRSAMAEVEFPPSVKDIGTLEVVAASSPVLEQARQQLSTPMTLQSLSDHVKVKTLSTLILSITAEAKTGQQAEAMANAVADSLNRFLSSNNTAVGKVPNQLLAGATTSTGTSPAVQTGVTTFLGALVGFILASIGAIAVGRGDKRLRARDAIADAIGVPVLVALPVQRPSNAARWTKLLESYEPSAAQAWRLRYAMQYLGVSDVTSQHARNSGNVSLTVLSLSSDPRALALGPQLAVYAAASGISTALVIGPQQDPNVTAALHAACAARPTLPERPGQLQVAVADSGTLDVAPAATLTIVVATVSGRHPHVAQTMRTTATVIGVSAGAATAEQLARVAANAAADGRQIDGILVADPDSADHTTGRVPQIQRPERRIQPTRVTGMTREIRR
jgi:capsular polysaccharide biosynthesis protein